MEDEIFHPISRNLFRQSSIEIPLSPSVPTDLDNPDDEKKSSVQSMTKKGALPKNDKSAAPIESSESMKELRDRFKNVGMIRVKPDSGAAIVPPKDVMNAGSNKDKKTIIPGSEKKEKEKPMLKPKTARKKNFPPVPGRSESLQKQITSTNALLMDELQGRQEKADLIKDVATGDVYKGEKMVPASNKNKKPQVKPKPPIRSDFEQQRMSVAPLMDELRNRCERSAPIQVSENLRSQPIPEYDTKNVNEPKNYPEIKDDLNSAGNTDTTNTVSTLKVMASPRPKSPRPVPVSAKKDEKEESFWEKIGTLGRKKRIKEVQDVQEEGKHAIDSPGLAANPDMPPEEYTLDENEERSMTEPRSLEDPKLQELIYVLIEWINDELADQRIIVKDIAEDLYDGQVLQKLLERLTSEKLDVPEVTQSEEGQKQKLAVVLSAANRVLNRYPPYKWSVDSVHSKNIVSILHLLVGLARQFRAPVRLPERVAIQLVVVRKKDGQLVHRTVREEITSTYEDLGMRCERDAFDTLFDHAPEKLAVVKKSLVTFVNKHLSKVHLEVTELDTQFHDGVFLTLLLGLLEGFFVPLGSFHLTPKTHDQKVHNVSFAFDLMQEIRLAKPKARPEDIVNLDLKSTLRVLYNLFTKYKGMN